MAATRTQIYLTEAQRRRLDEMCRLKGISLAEAVREAVDVYLAGSGDACDEALDETFGRAPQIQVPGRDEWGRDEWGRDETVGKTGRDAAGRDTAGPDVGDEA